MYQKLCGASAHHLVSAYISKLFYVEPRGAVGDTDVESKKEVTNLALSALESVTSIVAAPALRAAAIVVVVGVGDRARIELHSIISNRAKTAEIESAHQFDTARWRWRLTVKGKQGSMHEYAHD